MTSMANQSAGQSEGKPESIVQAESLRILLIYAVC